MLFPELDRLDAIDLAALVRRGAVHPRELVAAAIERIAARDGAINAVVHRRFERALAEAEGPLPDGPLRGVPFLLKDLMAEMAGEPLTSGSRFLRGFVAAYDAEIVKRYRAAGLVVLGRANTSELGIVGTVEPALHGACHNPWDLARSTGGSSGGSAAAVAARMVPAAAGGDGGGSIRIPASFCGLFGLKPTRGRTPLGPERGESWSGLTVQHALTRTVRDSALLLDVTQGPAPGDPYAAPAAPASFLKLLDEPVRPLRIALCDGSLLGRAIHPRCAQAVREAGALLRELGHEVELAAPQLEREALVEAFFTIVASNVARALADATASLGRRPARDELEPVTWFVNELGRRLRAPELLAALEAARRAGREMGRFHERYDLLLTSTTGTPPPRLGGLGPTPGELRQLATVARFPLRPLLLRALHVMGPEALEALPNTQPFNLTGQPAANVPMGWTDDGLPLGVQLVAAVGEEGRILQVAAQLETARPWTDRLPTMAADPGTLATGAAAALAP